MTVGWETGRLLRAIIAYFVVFCCIQLQAIKRRKASFRCFVFNIALMSLMMKEVVAIEQLAFVLCNVSGRQDFVGRPASHLQRCPSRLATTAITDKRNRESRPNYGFKLIKNIAVYYFCYRYIV
jgi:hypothetical protein